MIPVSYYTNKGCGAQARFIFTVLLSIAIHVGFVQAAHQPALESSFPHPWVAMTICPSTTITIRAPIPVAVPEASHQAYNFRLGLDQEQANCWISHSICPVLLFLGSWALPPGEEHTSLPSAWHAWGTDQSILACSLSPSCSWSSPIWRNAGCFLLAFPLLATGLPHQLPADLSGSIPLAESCISSPQRAPSWGSCQALWWSVQILWGTFPQKLGKWPRKEEILHHPHPTTTLRTLKAQPVKSQIFRRKKILMTSCSLWGPTLFKSINKLGI